MAHDAGAVTQLRVPIQQEGGAERFRTAQVGVSHRFRCKTRRVHRLDVRCKVGLVAVDAGASRAPEQFALVAVLHGQMHLILQW